MARVLIIGGGPAGLNAYIRFSELKYDVYLFEQSKVLGGHLRKYHPGELFRDIKGYNPMTAKTYTTLLLTRAQNKSERIFTGVEVKNIIRLENGDFYVYVNDNEKPFRFQRIILATGNGIGYPRRLGFEDEETADNIYYDCSQAENLEDKNVVLVSSGPSTLEYLKAISEFTNKITLVNRHDDFKENSQEIRSTPNLTMYLGHEVCDTFIADHHLESITITDRKHINKYELFCDAVIVNLGITLNQTKLITKEENTKTLEVDPATCMSSMPGIYVIGDYANYPGKVKRVNSTIDEIEKVVISIQTSDFDKNS